MSQFVRVTDEVRRFKSKAGEPFEVQVCQLRDSTGLAERFEQFVGRDGAYPPGDYTIGNVRGELENQGKFGRRLRVSYDLLPAKAAPKAA